MQPELAVRLVSPLARPGDPTSPRPPGVRDSSRSACWSRATKPTVAISPATGPGRDSARQTPAPWLLVWPTCRRLIGRESGPRPERAAVVVIHPLAVAKHRHLPPIPGACVALPGTAPTPPSSLTPALTPSCCTHWRRLPRYDVARPASRPVRAARAQLTHGQLFDRRPRFARRSHSRNRSASALRRHLVSIGSRSCAFVVVASVTRWPRAQRIRMPTRQPSQSHEAPTVNRTAATSQVLMPRIIRPCARAVGTCDRHCHPFCSRQLGLGRRRCWSTGGACAASSAEAIRPQRRSPVGR